MGKKKIEKVRDLCKKICAADNEAYARQKIYYRHCHNEDGLDAAYYAEQDELVRMYPELNAFFDKHEGIGDVEDLLIEASNKLPYWLIEEIANEWINKLDNL